MHSVASVVAECVVINGGEMDTRTLEGQAREYGNNPKQVEKRLRSAAKLLLTEYRKALNTPKARYDAQTRMLISADDRYALVWLLRSKPDQPESYLNQQTSEGCVTLLVIGGFEVNPNYRG